MFDCPDSWVNAYKSKFLDPYLKPRLTPKNIYILNFFITYKHGTKFEQIRVFDFFTDWLLRQGV